MRPHRNYRCSTSPTGTNSCRSPCARTSSRPSAADLLNRVRGGVDTSREIYFATYQALAAGGDREALFEAFRPDFFDLVIVDECHRGSAEENSAWRAVLDYFASAVQLGLTATPRSDRVNSYEYFGNPVYRYSLRQGIEDGFLAPYRVRRVVLSPDAEGWEPAPGQLDRMGREVPEGVYTTRDFERVVSLLARTRLASRHLSSILRLDATARCIVFCVDTEHADEMRRALVAENPDLVAADPEWVVRIVGVEGEKERLLGDFTDPDKVSPVVATRPACCPRAWTSRTSSSWSCSAQSAPWWSSSRSLAGAHGCSPTRARPASRSSTTSARRSCSRTPTSMATRPTSRAKWWTPTAR